MIFDHGANWREPRSQILPDQNFHDHDGTTVDPLHLTVGSPLGRHDFLIETIAAVPVHPSPRIAVRFLPVAPAIKARGSLLADEKAAPVGKHRVLLGLRG